MGRGRGQRSTQIKNSANGGNDGKYSSHRGEKETGENGKVWTERERVREQRNQTPASFQAEGIITEPDNTYFLEWMRKGGGDGRCKTSTFFSRGRTAKERSKTKTEEEGQEGNGLDQGDTNQARAKGKEGGRIESD